MDDKDVKSFLRICGLLEEEHDSNNQSEHSMYTRDELIPKLMNLTLQCLGTIRKLVIEQEKNRISKDCNDIDGTKRDDGKGDRYCNHIFIYVML